MWPLFFLNYFCYTCNTNYANAAADHLRDIILSQGAAVKEDRQRDKGAPDNPVLGKRTEQIEKNIDPRPQTDPYRPISFRCADSG